MPLGDAVSRSMTAEDEVPQGLAPFTRTPEPTTPVTAGGPGATDPVVRDVSDDDFDDAVVRAETPVLVDFWAPWCGPCLLVGPVLAEIAVELTGRLRVVRVNVDDNVGISTKHAVFSIPTLVLFKGGLEVERMVGFSRKEELVTRLRRHLDA